MKNDASAAIFEEILSQIRPFGYFQKRLFFLTSLIQALVTTVLLYLDFVYLNVKNSVCVSTWDLPENVSNVSTVTIATECHGDRMWYNQWEVPVVNSN
jgi:hypothetical protein